MNELYQPKNYTTPMLVLTYDIDAEQTLVYQAWTDLEIFKQWFLPTGFTVAKAELTAKAGGHFSIHMQSPEGEIYPTRGEYILLEKPNRLVYKDSWDDDRQDNEPTIAEIIFEPKGDKTTIKLYSSFASEQQKETMLAQGVVDGWKMFLNNLNTLLNK